MGIERREGEVVGPLSAKPRVGEGEREVGVVTSVGLCSQREGLTIALRDEASTFIAAAAEDILEGEVGELQAGTQEDARLSPTERELHLVAALCGEGIGDVYRSRLSIGANVFENLLGEVFWVELSHRGQFAHGALNGFHREEVAGLGAEFATDNVVIHAVVSGKSDAVERGLCAFGDAHFEVDAVAFHIDFDGLDAAEHVAIVVVLIAHGIFVGLQAFHHEGLVVEVAFLHFEGSGQSFGGIDGVAHPVDVAHIILLALADVEINIDVLGIDGHDRVGHH